MVNKADTKVVVNDNTTGAAYSDWPFKSLHFWGEKPSWYMENYSCTSGTVIVSHTTVMFKRGDIAQQEERKQAEWYEGIPFCKMVVTESCARFAFLC